MSATATIKNASVMKSVVQAPQQKAIIQPKLMVNAPGDRYEQEADAMAERVMRMPQEQGGAMRVTGLIGQSVQRKCAHCEEEERKKKNGGMIMRKMDNDSITSVSGSFIQRKCDKCKEEEEKKKKGILMRKANGSGGFEVSAGLEQQLSGTRGGGSPLPERTKSFMENAFSADFSNVRIHTGHTAASMNKEINAKAFTYGSDIYFNTDDFRPETEAGKKLIAHELTHTIQQDCESKIFRQPITDSDPALNSLTVPNINEIFNLPSPAELKKNIAIKNFFLTTVAPSMTELEQILQIAIQEYDFWNNVSSEPDKFPAQAVMQHYLLVNNIYSLNNDLVYPYVQYIADQLYTLNQSTDSENLVYDQQTAVMDDTGLLVLSYEKSLQEYGESMPGETYQRLENLFIQKPNPFGFGTSSFSLESFTTDISEMNVNDMFIYDLISITKEYQLLSTEDTSYLDPSIENLERLGQEYGSIFDLVERTYDQFELASDQCVTSIGSPSDSPGIADKIIGFVIEGQEQYNQIRNAAISSLQNGQLSCNDAFNMIDEAEDLSTKLALISIVSLGLSILAPGVGRFSKMAAEPAMALATEAVANLAIDTASNFASYAAERSVDFDSAKAQEIWDENTRDLSSVLTSIQTGFVFNTFIPIGAPHASGLLSKTLSPLAKFRLFTKLKGRLGFNSESLEKLMASGNIPSNELKQHSDMFQIELAAKDKLPSKISDDPQFDIEIELPNGHAWKKAKQEGWWCRNQDEFCYRIGTDSNLNQIIEEEGSRLDMLNSDDYVGPGKPDVPIPSEEQHLPPDFVPGEDSKILPESPQATEKYYPIGGGVRVRKGRKPAAPSIETPGTFHHGGGGKINEGGKTRYIRKGVRKLPALPEVVIELRRGTPKPIMELSDAERIMVKDAEVAKNALGEPLAIKTKAAVSEGDVHRSGFGERGSGPEATKKVLETGKEIGHDFKQNSSLDEGIAGQEKASHAEKIAAISNPGKAIAVDRHMCADCFDFFQKLSQKRQTSLVVQEPGLTWIFQPDGKRVGLMTDSITVIHPDGSVSVGPAQ